MRDEQVRTKGVKMGLEDANSSFVEVKTSQCD